MSEHLIECVSASDFLDEVAEELMTVVNKSVIHLTSKQLRDVERVSGYLSDKMMADFLGMSESTFRNKLQNNEQLRNAYMRGKAKMTVLAGEVIREKIVEERDFNSASFYLKNKGGWKETQQIEHSIDHKPKTIDEFFDSDEDYNEE